LYLELEKLRLENNEQIDEKTKQDCKESLDNIDYFEKNSEIW
jgi:hypothetical protein